MTRRYCLRINIFIFQLTRSRGAWRRIFMVITAPSLFQLTRSRGAWQTKTENLDLKNNFNSHAHVERDNESYTDCNYPKWFQLTRSRGAWPTYANTVIGNVIFQLTRSRGAWRLTLRPHHFMTEISTHTLTWSVTLHLLRLNCKNLHFNSHAHVERDRKRNR